MNRYSYVVNSPLTHTDPTGYGFFGNLLDPLGIFGGDGVFGTLGAIVNAVGDIIGYIGDGLEHLAHEVKTYWKVIVAVALAVVTCGIAAPAIAVWLAAMSITSTVAVGVITAAAMGAIAGGVMGATLTALNGGSVGDILSAGLRGAAIGAVAGALTWGAGYVSAGWGFVGQAVAHGVAGGLTGIASGGSFEKGFALAVLAYGAARLYQKIVGEKPLWQRPTGKACSGPNALKQCGNAWGVQKPGGPLSQGTSTISKIMDWAPAQNAGAWAHDLIGPVLLPAGTPSWVYYVFIDLPTIPFAEVLTYTALLDTSIGYGMTASYLANKSYYDDGS